MRSRLRACRHRPVTYFLKDQIEPCDHPHRLISGPRAGRRGAIRSDFGSQDPTAFSPAVRSRGDGPEIMPTSQSRSRYSRYSNPAKELLADQNGEYSPLIYAHWVGYPLIMYQLPSGTFALGGFAGRGDRKSHVGIVKPRGVAFDYKDESRTSPIPTDPLSRGAGSRPPTGRWAAGKRAPIGIENKLHIESVCSRAPGCQTWLSNCN